MSPPKIRGTKHRGLYVRNGVWWRNFWLDKKNHRGSTGIAVEWVRKPKGEDPGIIKEAPKEARAQVPLTQAQKESAVEAIRNRKAVFAHGTTELHAFTKEYLDRKPIPRGIGVKTSVLAHFTAFFPRGTDLSLIGKAAAHRYHQHIAGLYEDGEIAGATANQRLSYVRTMINHAIEIERIDGPNPFARFRRFPARNRELVLDRADEPIFLESCPKWLAMMVEDNLYLGLRPGEIRELPAKHFRPNEGAHGYIILDVSETKGGRLKVAQGHTPASRTARIALTPEARERMSRRPSTLVHPYFYSGPTGRPVNKSTMEKAVKNAWANAAPKIAARRGVSLEQFQEEVAGKGGFSFYTTRHTAATRDGEAGYTISELQQKYRWEDPKMANTYVHSSDEWAERAARKRAEAEG